MTTRVFLLLLAPLLLAGADQKKKPAAKPAQPASQSKAAGIPPDAKEIEPGVYRWKDRQGKTWILRKSPFGIMKGEEHAVEVPQLPEGLTVAEEGDELRFERPTPFGLVRWTRKKTELNEMEQRAWEREQAKKAAPKAKE